MAGTVEALMFGAADLAIGLPADTLAPAGIELKPLGEAPFVYVVAPHHLLASAEELFFARSTRCSSSTAAWRSPIRRSACRRTRTTSSLARTC